MARVCAQSRSGALAGNTLILSSVPLEDFQKPLIRLCAGSAAECRPRTCTSRAPEKAEKVLEINAAHPIAEKLRALYENDRDKLSVCAKKRADSSGANSAPPIFFSRRK